MLEAYDWLVKHGPDRANKPADVEYPAWVSFTNEGTMMNSENTVILELSLDPAIITSVNTAYVIQKKSMYEKNIRSLRRYL